MFGYSVFLFNVGSCSDRYCPAYGRDFKLDELFDRVVSIPRLSAVDIVLNDMIENNSDRFRARLDGTGLKVASVAVDTFAKPVYRKGSLSSPEKAVRAQAICDAKRAVDFARSVGCGIVTLWPGQDGYDYLFAADYIRERTLFSDALAEIADYARDIRVTLEYKLKEPRTHCYINTVGSTLLMVNTLGRPNLGVALDYGHAALGGENPAEAVAMCKMYGDRLYHIHINDNYGVWDDDMIVGSVHTLAYLEFLYWLKKTGYTGYITLDQYPYREDGRDAVAESAEWLCTLERAAERIDGGEAEKIFAMRDGAASSRFMRELLFH